MSAATGRAQPAGGSEKAPVAAGASVTFRDAGQPFPVAVGESVCEAAEKAGYEINAECHSGICGSDPIRIVAGGENVVDEPGAGPCRLACMLRVKEPIEVEKL